MLRYAALDAALLPSLAHHLRAQLAAATPPAARLRDDGPDRRPSPGGKSGDLHTTAGGAGEGMAVAEGEVGGWRAAPLVCREPLGGGGSRPALTPLGQALVRSHQVALGLYRKPLSDAGAAAEAAAAAVAASRAGASAAGDRGSGAQPQLGTASAAAAAVMRRFFARAGGGVHADEEDADGAEAVRAEVGGAGQGWLADAVTALCRWRDATARRWDVGPQALMPDVALAALAVAAPVPRHGPAVLAVVAAATAAMAQVRPPTPALGLQAGAMAWFAFGSCRIAMRRQRPCAPHKRQPVRGLCLHPCRSAQPPPDQPFAPRFQLHEALRADAPALARLLAAAAAGRLPAGGALAASGAASGAAAAPAGGKRERANAEERRQWLIDKFRAKSQARAGRLDGRGAGQLGGEWAGPGRLRPRSCSYRDRGRARTATEVVLVPRPRSCSYRQVYDNCRMLSREGALLCYCDARKLQWYLARGLAAQVRVEGLGEGGWGEGRPGWLLAAQGPVLLWLMAPPPRQVSDSPPTIQLLFEHNTTDQQSGADDFYTHSKANRCVACGCDSQ